MEGSGSQPSWPCAPLPGGGLPPSSPSHPVCAWLGCRHTAPAASPVPARASVWVSGEAWGGPVWEPLPSFRAGDQPGAESPGCGRGRLALARAGAVQTLAECLRSGAGQQRVGGPHVRLGPLEGSQGSFTASVGSTPLILPPPMGLLAGP